MPTRIHQRSLTVHLTKHKLQPALPKPKFHIQINLRIQYGNYLNLQDHNLNYPKHPPRRNKTYKYPHTSQAHTYSRHYISITSNLPVNTFLKPKMFSYLNCAIHIEAIKPSPCQSSNAPKPLTQPLKTIPQNNPTLRKPQSPKPNF